MNFSRAGKLQSAALGLIFASAGLVYAQDTTGNKTTTENQTTTENKTPAEKRTAAPSDASSQTVSSGQKMKLKGIVTKRSPDTFTIRDESGVETVVSLNDQTSVKTKGGFLRSGKNYGQTVILRGLSLEVEGRGDGAGQLNAEKIRFNDSDLRVAQSLQVRVDPVENRVGTAENRIGDVEQNAKRLSGQLDELAAVSNAAKGGAVAAQAAADAAIAGVNTTNERISAIDDYAPQQSVTVNFKVNSANLLPEATAKLDEIAQQALSAKGYVLEVGGFASADGGTEFNRKLSERRADAVIRYLVENHKIPLRRIITPFGYGEAQAVADNATREGREQNRRVEVKVLVSKGLIQAAPTMTPAAATSSNQ